MDRSLYVGMTGASQILQAQAVLAQNLANVSTTGYRADMHVLASAEVPGAGFGTRVNTVAQSTGFSSVPGTVTQTGAPLDVSIQGNGWFAVQARDGTEAYTRAGDFHLTADGQLVTATGLPVMGDGGAITVPPADTMSIGSDGTISIVPQGVGPKGASQVGRLKLVNPPLTQLAKGADGLMRSKDGLAQPSDSTVQVASGALESSNVNAPAALVQMIQMSRLFEMQTRLMNATDQIEQTAQKLLAPA